MEELYERAISPTASLGKRETGNLDSFIARSRRIEKLLSLVKRPQALDIKLLDFGMGWGHLALAAKALGASVTGIEISAQRVKFAQRMGLNVAKNLEELAEERFSVINADQVLEHVPDPLGLLAEFRQRLEPDGMVSVTVPSFAQVREALMRSRYTPGNDALHPLEHLQAFSWQALNKMAHMAGLVPLTRRELNQTLFRYLRDLSQRNLKNASWVFRRSDEV